MLKILIPTVLVLALTACDRGPARQPAATVQALMSEQVDPAADEIWGLVGTVYTRAGVEERQPRTAEEWRDARAHALKLIDGAKRLAKTRAVTPPGHEVTDVDTPGTRTARQITADIAADPVKFQKAAERLQRGGEAALAAIEARDIAGILVAGEAMDEACDGCHSAYWFPRTDPGVFPDSETFARIAAVSAR